MITGRDLLRYGLAALAYVAAGKLGLSLASLNPSASPVWAPTGIAIAALLLLGLRAWPAIFVAAFVVNVTTAGSLATSLAIAAGNALEAIAGAWLIGVYCGGLAAFERTPRVFTFSLIALLAPVVSATIGVTSLLLGGFVDADSYRIVWMTWWLGDVTGALIVTPLVVIWSRPDPVHPPRMTVPLTLGLTVSSALAGVLIFTGVQPLAIEHAPVAFVFFPLLAFAAYSFGPRGASLFIAVLSAVAEWGTLQGYGPFVREVPNDSLLFLQSFMAVAQVTSLALAAADTERRRADAALRRAEEDKVRERDEFLSIAAHELRTPITSLQLAVQLLLRRVEAGGSLQSPEITRALFTMRGQITNLTRLVGQLLDNVRLDEGRMPIERQQIDVTALVGRIAEEVRAMRADVEIAVGAGDVTASVDPLRLEQVVRNLLDNAVKFSPRGARVDVTVSATQDDVCIAVRDRGDGVPVDRRAALFQRYQHDNSWQHSGGLGLGLYVSRQIVERHGGRIAAEFPDDGGTRMLVTLPRDATS